MGTNLSPQWERFRDGDRPSGAEPFQPELPSAADTIPAQQSHLDTLAESLVTSGDDGSSREPSGALQPHADVTGSHSRRHLSNPLGNAALVLLADGGVICLRRGTAVGEMPGQLVFPGGHAEVRQGEP